MRPTNAPSYGNPSATTLLIGFGINREATPSLGRCERRRPAYTGFPAVWRRNGPCAFTLIEMLIVITIIALLAGIGLPTYAYMRTQARMSSAKAMVMAVQNAIASYELRVWTTVDASTGQPSRVYRNLWDLNEDGFLDGDPALYAPPGSTPPLPFDPAIVTPVGSVNLRYRGFYDMAGTSLPGRKNIDSSRRLLDPWGQPLRISFGKAYGTREVGIWSSGPDKGLLPSADDVTSWK
jgi:prepilin-type N-terminal cleavage/methylation domain-containing protein